MSAMLALLTLVAVQDGCPAGAEPVPPALSGWGTGATIAASSDPRSAPGLSPGATATLSLHPSDHVDLIAPPQRKSAGASNAGYAAVEITTPGTYRVALSDRAWIEVLKDGKAIRSTAHGHGPRCSGMRKIVDFELAKGRHLLQISGNPTATLHVMVVAAQ